MKNILNKKFSIILGVLAIFIVSSAAYCQPEARGDNNHEWRQRWEQKREKFRHRVEEELNLTEEQGAKFEPLREQYRKTMKALRDDLQEKRKELRDEISKADTNRPVVDKIVLKIKEINSRIIDHLVEYTFAAKDILTPEQFEKLNVMKEKRMKGKAKRFKKYMMKEMDEKPEF